MYENEYSFSYEYEERMMFTRNFVDCVNEIDELLGFITNVFVNLPDECIFTVELPKNDFVKLRYSVPIRECIIRIQHPRIRKCIRQWYKYNIIPNISI